MKKTTLLFTCIFFNIMLSYGAKYPSGGYEDPYLTEDEFGFKSDNFGSYSDYEDLSAPTKQNKGGMGIMTGIYECTYCQDKSAPPVGSGNWDYNECLDWVRDTGATGYAKKSCPYGGTAKCTIHGHTALGEGPAGSVYTLLILAIGYGVFLMYRTKRKKLQSVIAI